jgi:hypothetical protein
LFGRAVLGIGAADPHCLGDGVRARLEQQDQAGGTENQQYEAEQAQ